MGRSTTPRYVVEMSGGFTAAAWRVRQDGRPTDANLARYVAGFEASTAPGGVNAHLGTTRVRSAKVRENSYGGEVVARYQAPMFEAAGSWVPCENGVRVSTCSHTPRCGPMRPGQRPGEQPFGRWK
jgi:hypothetical protein